jgi:MraZ protein
MFLGQHEHTIDEKGRLIIPARYREPLEAGAFITRGFDQNLIVLTASHFEQIYQRVNQMSMTDPSARSLRRLMFANADRVQFDKTGRILIPQFLRETAGLNSSVVVVGVGEFFEIWSAEQWAKQSEQLGDTETNTQRFAALNL